ncbi:SLAM family member 6 isoform X1 [Sigmodon hispidus]
MDHLRRRILTGVGRDQGNEVSYNSTSIRVMNGVLGGSVTLPLELPAGKKTSNIIWHYKGEASPVTTILFINLNDFKSPQILQVDSKREKRLKITQSFSLQVSNLTMADTGLYSAQITTENSDPNFIAYTLRVFEQLSNLEVANHIHLFENGTCEIHLTCVIRNVSHNVSVGWQASGSTSLRKPNLTVSWDLRNSHDQTYTCQAENPVSNVSASVSAQRLCTGALTKENLHWNENLLIIPLLCIVFLCIGVWLCKKRRGSLFLVSQSPDSSQNTEDTPGSPGNTVYAQVTYPIQDEHR